MFDPNRLSKIQKILPILWKLDLYEIGVLTLIFFTLYEENYFATFTETMSKYNSFFSQGIYISIVIIGCGLLRKTTAIKLTHTVNQDPIGKLQFLRVNRLKVDPYVQIPMEISLGSKLLRYLPSFFIEKINFFLILTYYSDQIKLVVTSVDKSSCEIKHRNIGNKEKTTILINKHIGKSEFIFPMLVIPQNLEDEKEICIYLSLEPIKHPKLLYPILKFFSYLLFSGEKLVLNS